MVGIAARWGQELLLILIKDKNVCWMYECTACGKYICVCTYILYIQHIFIQVANIVVNIVAIGYIKQICMDRCTYIYKSILHTYIYILQYI